MSTGQICLLALFMFFTGTSVGCVCQRSANALAPNFGWKYFGFFAVITAAILITNLLSK